ncbi:metal-dependent hydrolase [Exiguobacterium sp. AM39-5BH]|uniref:metal-dependent hydrolase n=1 Tax=Exiguobacterium sp. AM39-5BH TaxID=2292355 RepID=UPI000FE239F3|nr:metal-dependent hydrolase [Exiguobacterium sp. AM39-5BH]RHB51893.1 metal-dependent hydrolase [Exiguobacterium sp. AM39-5BH]
MKITYYGHATVHLDIDGTSVLIDPFLTSNPHTNIDPASVKANYILLTHAHFDHIEDVELIAKQTGATIVATHELATYYEKKGYSVHGMNIGGGHPFPFGRVTMTQAFHSSSLDMGDVPVYMGMPGGFIIETDALTVYHAGDTALFSDMKLYGERFDIDVAFLPIGDNFTMGPVDALDAAHWLQAKRVVPIHFDTFPPIKQDARAFCDQLHQRGLLIEPNTTIEI